MNTPEYSDEEGQVLAAALTEWRQHLTIALDRIPADAPFLFAPDRAIQIVAGTVDGLLARLQGPDRIEVTSKAGRSYIPATRDGEVQAQDTLPPAPMGRKREIIDTSTPEQRL